MQIFKILYCIILLSTFLNNACLSQTVYHSNHYDNTEIIRWSGKRKLTWNDFKGISDSATLREFNYAKAAICASIEIISSIKNGLITYEVMNWFVKEKSWTLDTTHAQLLTHEQGHFDISEVYSRRIRKRIRELEKNEESDEDVIFAMVQEMKNKLEQEQNKYDDSTMHGAIDSFQEEWCAKIREELSLLQEFEQK